MLCHICIDGCNLQYLKTCFAKKVLIAVSSQALDSELFLNAYYRTFQTVLNGSVKFQSSQMTTFANFFIFNCSRLCLERLYCMYYAYMYNLHTYHLSYWSMPTAHALIGTRFLAGFYTYIPIYFILSSITVVLIHLNNPVCTNYSLKHCHWTACIFPYCLHTEYQYPFGKKSIRYTSHCLSL